LKIISIGEVLWDVIGANEHLGGAPFNFSAQAKKLGHDVWFVSAVGEDERGDRIISRMSSLGLAADFVRKIKDQPTGVVTVSVDAHGQPSYVIHRPAAYDFPSLAEEDLKLLSSPDPDWIYYGTLQHTSAQAKAMLMQLLQAFPSAKRFYDINLRKDCYSLSLVRELGSQADILKLNDHEIAEVAEMFSWPQESLESFCQRCAQEFQLEAVCVTRGSLGSSLWREGKFIEADGYPTQVADSVGAGDAFAAAFLHGLGRDGSAALDFANRVGALVVSRPGATPDWTVEEALALTHNQQTPRRALSG
jgi:fructokinase